MNHDNPHCHGRECPRREVCTRYIAHLDYLVDSRRRNNELESFIDEEECRLRDNRLFRNAADTEKGGAL